MAALASLSIALVVTLPTSSGACSAKHPQVRATSCSMLALRKLTGMDIKRALCMAGSTGDQQEGAAQALREALPSELRKQA